MPRAKRGTLRLTVTYGPDGAEVVDSELIGFTRVLRDATPKPGLDTHWVTVEGGAGRRFVRHLPDPAIGREVFSPDGSITRTEAARTMTVDVPWWGDESAVVFHGPALGAERLEIAPGPWRELGRFRPADVAFEKAGGAAPFPVVRLPFGTGNPHAKTLVFMAEGFRAGELDLYQAAVDAFLEKLSRTAPFHDLLAALAALRIDSVSAQSGIDDGAAKVDTWLDGHFGLDKLRRLIEVDQTRAMAAAKAAAGALSFVGVVVVNTTEYGGSGGQVAVFSRHPDSPDIALHELGHTLFNLADEYSDAVPNAGAPSEVNVTLKPDPSSSVWSDTDRQRLKWKADLAVGVPMPTSSNPDCAHADTRPLPHGVGAFEGGKYSHCRVFRPSADCKMRTLSADFCPVCQRQIRAKLQTFL